MERPEPRRRGGIARAAALLVSLTAVSQLLGFVRDAVIASVFGVGASMDAYLVAQGVMNLVLALVAGAIARAIVPPVSRAAATGDPQRAHRTVQTALTVTVIVLVVGAAVMFLAAETVVGLLAPGFDPGTRNLAASLTRIVLIATVFVALTNILAATAQAHGRFFHSGVQGVPFNLVMIGAAAWFGTRYGVTALAIGFVLGSAARMLIQLPPARAVGLRPRPRFAVRDPDFREAMRLTPALLMGSAVANVNTLVDRAVGSGQGEGVITALNFGWRTVTLVDTLLVVTVVAALYPAFSAVGGEADRPLLRDMVGRSCTVMLVILTPIAALLIVAAKPIVDVVFGRGDFDSAAVQLTATAVAAYAVCALGLAIRSIAARACFAVGDGRTPVLVAVVSMVVNVVGDLTLGIAYGIPGLAASTSISLVGGAVLLVVLLARRHAAVSLPPLLVALGRVIAAAVVASGATVLLGLSTWNSQAPGIETALRLLAAGLVLVAVYLGVLVLLRSPELRTVAQIVRERLNPRPGAR